MSKEQFESIVTSQFINQSMLSVVLQTLDFKEERIRKICEIGINAADKYLKELEEMEKENEK